MNRTAVALLLQQRLQTFDEPVRPPRSAQVVQVGVVFGENIADVESSIGILADMTNICAFASHAVLYERERYFDRAIRQCHHGQMLKSGPHDEIKYQVTKLDELRKDGCWGLPLVSSPRDKDLGNEQSSSTYSWYFMRRFRLPSLKELLTSVPGLADYEVRAITRRAIGHLKASFWHTTSQEDVHRNMVQLPLYLTAQMAKDLGEHFKACTKSIRYCEPLKTSRGVTLQTISALSGLQHIVKHFGDGRNARAIFKSRHTETPFIRVCSPKVIADKLEAMAKRSSSTALVKLRKDGSIHGDAHFENILVDASIPEDPVVVSIDPSYPDKKRFDKHIKDYGEFFKIKTSELKEEEMWLFKDRTYDYAKLLVSGWLLYSVAAIDGFSIDKVRGGWRFKLRDDKIIEDSSEKGGVSGAGVNSVTTIPKEVIRYHNEATSSIRQAFLDELPARFIEASEGKRVTWERLMVVRLWALTIRHGLSVCIMTYPKKARVACSLYMLTASQFEAGVPVVEDVISGNCDLSARELAANLLAPRFPAVRNLKVSGIFLCGNRGQWICLINCWRGKGDILFFCSGGVLVL
jgi:hypothetical protein